MNQEVSAQEPESQPDFGKIILFTLFGLLILGGVALAGVRFSQRKEGQVILPQGTYLGPSPQGAPTGQPPTAPLTFTTDPGTPWVSFKGTIFPYTFSHPNTLPLATFPNDESDSVGIVWGNIAPEKNILLNLELIEKRDPAFVRRPKEQYVRSWHKYFTGLKDIASLTTFENSNGLKGYRARFINTADQTPNVDVFFEVPERDDLMIHLANGVLDPAIFDRIVDSVKILPLSPTPTSGASAPTGPAGAS